MTELLQRILPTVQKPARYTGGEFNEIQKDPASVRVNVAFCFPDRRCLVPACVCTLVRYAAGYGAARTSSVGTGEPEECEGF